MDPHHSARRHCVRDRCGGWQNKIQNLTIIHRYSTIYNTFVTSTDLCEFSLIISQKNLTLPPLQLFVAFSQTQQNLHISWSRDSISTVLCHSIPFKRPNEQGGATVEIESRDKEDMREPTVLFLSALCNPRCHVWSVTWLDFYPNVSSSNTVVMNQSRAFCASQLFPFFYSPHKNSEMTTAKYVTSKHFHAVLCGSRDRSPVEPNLSESSLW